MITWRSPPIWVKLPGKYSLEQEFQEALNSYKWTIIAIYVILYIASTVYHVACSAAEVVPSGSVPLVPALKLGIFWSWNAWRHSSHWTIHPKSKLDKRIAYQGVPIPPLFPGLISCQLWGKHSMHMTYSFIWSSRWEQTAVNKWWLHTLPIVPQSTFHFFKQWHQWYG